jgi:phage gpG-like protein
MTAEPTWRLDGDEAALAFIRALMERASDIQPTSSKVANVYRDSERRTLGGSGWAALAQSTVERKARADLPAETLRATGKLKQSLRDAMPYGHDKYRIRMGTPVAYAIYHQHGIRSGKGSGPMPARLLIDISEMDTKLVEAILLRYIGEGQGVW